MADQTLIRAFRDFAPVIRELIYECCLFSEPNLHSSLPKTPVLLAALRGELRLYQEALHFYYKHNAVMIDSSNVSGFTALGPSFWNSMRHISICPP